MSDMLTLYVRLTKELREALQGRFGLLTPISEAEAVVFGEGVEALPELLAIFKAEAIQLGAGPELIERIDVAFRISLMIREALRRSVTAGALVAPEIGRVQ